MRRAVSGAFIAFLVGSYFILLLVGGVVFLIDNPWMLKWLWVPVPIGLLVALVIKILWEKNYGGIWRPEFEVPEHWTEKDREAAEIVENSAEEAAGLPDLQVFSSPEHYTTEIRNLADKLAKHYDPKAKDFLDSLTILELLAAVELAAQDLHQLVRDRVPGSHVYKIRTLRSVWTAVSWAGWGKGVLKYAVYVFHGCTNPVAALIRVGADHVVGDPAVKQTQHSFAMSLYQVFILLLGKRLIELYSGRLKVGAARWRELMVASSETPDASSGEASAPSQPDDRDALTIAVVGQVKAGKSSLINALLGEQKAAVDILPLTNTVTSHRLRRDAIEEELVLLDTIGYAHAGGAKDKWADTMDAVRQSAMTILVMDACQPARDPDLVFLREMEAWFADRPRFRRPPVLVVLTHIDELSPKMEWEPPYAGWLKSHPKRTKEKNIREAVEHVQQLLGASAMCVVPAYTKGESECAYGIEEWVLPAFLSILPEAKSKHLIDALYADSDRGKIFSQLLQTGRELVKLHFLGPSAVVPDPEDSHDE